MKILVPIGLFAGSTLGGMVPYLWGDTEFLSFSSVIFSILGGLVGLIIAVKIAKAFEV